MFERDAAGQSPDKSALNIEEYAIAALDMAFDASLEVDDAKIPRAGPEPGCCRHHS